MKTVKEMIIKYKETWSYLVFGVLTTVVDYIVAILCFEVIGLGELFSNNVAWAVSVAFAYITNKLFVFESKSFQWEILAKEIVAFVSARVVTLIIADVIILGAKYLNIEFLIAKIISSVFVIVFNYIFSKLFIFKSKGKEKENE